MHNLKPQYNSNEGIVKFFVHSAWKGDQNSLFDQAVNMLSSAAKLTARFQSLKWSFEELQFLALSIALAFWFDFISKPRGLSPEIKLK